MTYGTNAPQGLQPYSMVTGACWNQQTTPYAIASGFGTNLFQGDPVIFDDNGGVPPGTGTLERGGNASSPYLGVFWGVQYRDANGTLINSPYWPANTVTWNPGGSGNVAATAFIIDDPNVVYNIQCTGTGAVTGSVDTIRRQDIGYNYAITFATNGSTVSGLSGAALNLATQATTAALSLKLIGLTPAINNAFSQTFNNGLVIINNHVFKGGTGTAGI